MGRGWALVTGASSGLGRALARRCVVAGWDVVLVARRKEALREIAGELEHAQRARGTGHTPSRAQIHVVALDLAAERAIERLEAELATAGIDPASITLLVNNAGVGELGPFIKNTTEQIDAAIALNVRAVTQVVHRFAPLMRPGSTICTIASVAAFAPGPLMAVYYATKAYALSLGEALHEELRPRGIRVVTVCPGPFRSGFHASAGIRAAGRLPTSDMVAVRVMRAVKRGRAVTPIGFGAWIWALTAPRLPRVFARRIIGWLQARRGRSR